MLRKRIQNRKVIIHLVHTQHFPKNEHFLPADAHTNVCVSGVRNISFSKNFADVINE